MDCLVVYITAFVRIERSKLDANYLKKIKSRVLKGVTKCVRMFDELGVANSIVDKNIVDGFSTAIGTNDRYRYKATH